MNESIRIPKGKSTQFINLRDQLFLFMFNDFTDNSRQNRKDKIYPCNNCGLAGHTYNRCKEPVTSWGIILIDAKLKNQYVETDINCFDGSKGVSVSSSDDLQQISCHINSIKFLLVQRKHSLGYIEFMRGRYAKDNIDGIIYLFQQMTQEEIDNIGKSSFEELWGNLWVDSAKQYAYKKEFLESKEKFECLKNKIDVELPLSFYVTNVIPHYNSLEWGFPKGRKTKGESDLECAIREFCEETGMSSSDIKIITNIKPIIENMTGTNGVSYRHIYYVAEYIGTNVISNECISNNINNNSEIGGIGFFSYCDVEKMLREYHIEKKNIAKNILLYYLDTCVNRNADTTYNKTSWNNESDNF